MGEAHQFACCANQGCGGTNRVLDYRTILVVLDSRIRSVHPKRHPLYGGPYRAEVMIGRTWGSLSKEEREALPVGATMTLVAPAGWDPYVAITKRSSGWYFIDENEEQILSEDINSERIIESIPGVK